MTAETVERTVSLYEQSEKAGVSAVAPTAHRQSLKLTEILPTVTP